MNTRQQLDALLAQLPEQELSQLLELARELAHDEDREAWLEFGRQQLARCYGPDEPDYSLADVKSREST